MTEAMKITLSTQPADARWGEKATYSINNDGITLHLNGADDLGLIQRAARKIDGLGIKHVQLSGEGWDADRCWAFWQGYKAPKGTRKVEWPDLDDAQRQELDNRLMIIDWVRDTINAPAEELGPSQLAQRAVDLISNVAGDRVTYRITKGEDLREQGYMGLHTVGRGSERSPVLLALDYNPTGDKEAPVYACLVGKGITFDSGGYSIKQTAFMDSMKSDMGGAATVTGALAFAITRGLNKRVKLQQAGVYLAVMNQAGRYDYSNPATLFTLSDIGVSAHRYHNRLDIFTQSLENGAAQQGIEVSLLNEKGQTLTQATSDAQGHVQLENDKNAALLLARKDGQTTLLDLKLPALDLAEFNIAGAPGYSKQFFMFGPRDLYRPGETVILNGLLRDADGKALPNQPIKLDVIKPDGQVLRSVVSQPENGLYHFTWPLDSNAATGMWHIRANTGDNQYRMWDFHVEDFMPERMALNLTGEKTLPMPVLKEILRGALTHGKSAR